MSCCSSYWTGRVAEPTLFIPNLPSSIKEIDLRNAFSGLSVSLISIQQKYIAGNWRNRGQTSESYFARIDFATVEHAEKALAITDLRSVLNFETTEKPVILSPKNSMPIATSLAMTPRLVKLMPPNYTASQLYDVIRPFGSIASARIYAGIGGMIIFQTEEEGLAAELRVKSAFSRAEKITLQAFDSRQLHITNLNVQVDVDLLRTSFESFGRITHLEIVDNKKSRVSLHAYITFETHDQALNALNSINGALLCGRAVAVRFKELKSNSQTIPTSVNEELTEKVNEHQTSSTDQEMTEITDSDRHASARIETQTNSESIGSNTGEPSSNGGHENASGPPEMTNFRLEMLALRKEMDELKRAHTATTNIFPAEELEFSAKEAASITAGQVRRGRDTNAHQAKIQDMESEAESLRRAAGDARQAVAMLQTDITGLKDQHQQDMDMLQIQSDELAKLRRTLVDAQLELQNSQSQVETLSLTIEESKALRQADEMRARFESDDLHKQVLCLEKEKETLENVLQRTRHENDLVHQELAAFKYKWSISESRCKVLQLEIDRPVWEEAKRKREEAEKEVAAREQEQRRRAQVEESERKMREMRAQEKAKEDAKRKQRQKEEEERKAKERKVEEEHRARERKEQKQIAKEKEAERVRMDAWRAATSYEKERRNKKDLKWSKGWTNRRALDRFMAVLEYFETKSFSEQLPLVNSSVPWPILENPMNFQSVDLEWSHVEEFFVYVKTQITDRREYRMLLARVHKTFHPDKWHSRRVLNSVIDVDQREKMESWGIITSQAITPLWWAAMHSKQK